MVLAQEASLGVVTRDKITWLAQAASVGVVTRDKITWLREIFTLSWARRTAEVISFYVLQYDINTLSVNNL
jgi:hypothetical protein